ncbi:MAG: type II toxin-antitoxin system RelE/ParE family toxin [Variovorax sp.]
MKRIERTARASADIDTAVDRYLEIAGPDVARRFLAEYDSALAHITRHPGTGSPRYARMGEGTPLRHWMLKRFPHSVFYVAREKTILIVRVLQQASDIGTRLLDPDLD